MSRKPENQKGLEAWLRYSMTHFVTLKTQSGCRLQHVKAKSKYHFRVVTPRLDARLYSCMLNASVLPPAAGYSHS